MNTTAPLLYTLTETARLLGMGRGAARAFCAYHGCLVDDGAGGVRVSAAALARACDGAPGARVVTDLPRAELPRPEWQQ